MRGQDEVSAGLWKKVQAGHGRRLRRPDRQVPPSIWRNIYRSLAARLRVMYNSGRSGPEGPVLNG